MPSSPSFVEHALDLLSAVGPVRARAMFGGHGVYCADVMFGLLDDDELFLKTDAGSRPRFVEAGCRMWVYPGMSETSYYRPPDEAHEDAESMLPWARLALDAALRGRAAKSGAKRRARGASSGRAAGTKQAAGRRKPARPRKPAGRSKR